MLGYEQPTKYIVERVDYADNYQTPVLTANHAFTFGYTDETCGFYYASPKDSVIIFDDFTTDTKFVDFKFKVKPSVMKILKNKDANKSDIRFLYYLIKSIKFNAEVHKRYWISEYSNIEIPLPLPIEARREIVAEIKV